MFFNWGKMSYDVCLNSLIKCCFINSWKRRIRSEEVKQEWSSTLSQRVCCTAYTAIPKIRNKYFQKRNCVASVPISTFMCLWAIYTYIPTIGRLFCSWKICGPILGIYTVKRSHTHECGNWGCGRAIPFLGIHKWDFRSSVQEHSQKPKAAEDWT